MKIINEGNLTIKKLLKNDNNFLCTKKRIDPFVITHRYNEDTVLLYHTFTKELIAITKEEFKKIFIEGNEKLNRELINHCFLTSVNIDCFDTTQKIRNILLMMRPHNDINNYSILTTSKCNARCFYCFQSAFMQCDMNDDVALELAKKMIEGAQKSEIKIKWFGGEPLCNIRAIDIISKHLQDEEIKYSSIMTSNGFLFDENIVKKANKLWNLKRVQITLDGTEKTYNRIKNYKDVLCESPFNKVIKNIGLLINSQIIVNIRFNLDNYNEKDLYKLVDILYNLYGKNKYLRIYVHLLFDDTSPKHLKQTEYEKLEMIYKQIKLENYISLKGMDAKKSFSEKIKIFNCYADSLDSLVVFPTGDYGCCEMKIDQDIIGNVYTGIVNTNIKETYRNMQDKTRFCKNCAFAPACFRNKKCPEHTRRCETSDRILLHNKITKIMIDTYEKYLGVE